MIRLNGKWCAAIAALTLGLGAATGALAWPPPGHPYVQMTYYLQDGQIVGMRFVSFGCEYPQPPGWGIETADERPGARQDCYGPAPASSAPDAR